MDQERHPGPGCQERDQVIDELLKRRADLERRLDQRERAAQRQAAPFSQGPPRLPPNKPGRKKGAGHGPHAHRPPPPPETLHETLGAPLPPACPHRGGQVREGGTVDEQFRTDLPSRPIRRKFRIHQGCCKTCGRRVRGRHPWQTSEATGAAQSRSGPNAQAGIVYLSKRGGLAYGKIADYFREANGIGLHPSTATRIVLRAADRLQPVYDSSKDSSEDSEVLVPDETGGRAGGRPVRLHCWVGDRATGYVIDPRRRADALEGVIGRDYSGTLIHDGFASYDRFTEALHRQRGAQALRRAHGPEEIQAGRARVFPRQALDLFGQALDLRDAYRAGQRSRAGLEVAYGDDGERLHRLSERPRRDEANGRFARIGTMIRRAGSCSCWSRGSRPPITRPSRPCERRSSTGRVSAGTGRPRAAGHKRSGARRSGLAASKGAPPSASFATSFAAWCKAPSAHRRDPPPRPRPFLRERCPV